MSYDEEPVTIVNELPPILQVKALLHWPPSVREAAAHCLMRGINVSMTNEQLYVYFGGLPDSMYKSLRAMLVLSGFEDIGGGAYYSFKLIQIISNPYPVPSSLHP